MNDKKVQGFPRVEDPIILRNSEDFEVFKDQNIYNREKNLSKFVEGTPENVRYILDEFYEKESDFESDGYSDGKSD